MSEISELERRITAALDRASQALDKLSAATTADGDSGDLAAELEAERVANAQLEERVRAIKDKQETMVARLEADVLGTMPQKSAYVCIAAWITRRLCC